MQKTKSSSSSPESNSTCRRQRALHPVQKKDILRAEGKEIFEYIHSSYKTFQRYSRHSSHKTFQGHSRYSRHSSHSWHLAFQALLHVPVSSSTSSTSRVPPHYSILQLECIFYIFYTSTGFHKKLHRVPVETLQTFILQRKGDVAILVKIRITYQLKMSSRHLLWNRINPCNRLVHQELLIERMTFTHFSSSFEWSRVNRDYH